jgi:hypothetical protein
MAAPTDPSEIPSGSAPIDADGGRWHSDHIICLGAWRRRRDANASRAGADVGPGSGDPEDAPQKRHHVPPGSEDDEPNFVIGAVSAVLLLGIVTLFYYALVLVLDLEVTRPPFVR